MAILLVYSLVLELINPALRQWVGFMGVLPSFLLFNTSVSRGGSWGFFLLFFFLTLFPVEGVEGVLFSLLLFNFNPLSPPSSSSL